MSKHHPALLVSKVKVNMCVGNEAQVQRKGEGMPFKDKAKNDEAKRNWKLHNPDKVKSQGQIYFMSNKDIIYFRWLLRTHNLTKEEYDTMLELQGGVCAICGGVNANGWRLCLDHNHLNNTPRGILCRRCNSLLGLAQDNIDLLENAIGYLRENI